MIKLIFATLLLTLTLFGSETFEIKGSLNHFNSSTYMGYIQDTNDSLTPEMVLEADNLETLNKNGQIGNKFGPFWSRLEIKNSTDEIKNLILYNGVPGINYIDVYIYKNTLLKESHLLGDMREPSTKELQGRHSMFELVLAPDEELIIISKVNNYNITNLGWIISDNNLFFNHESLKLVMFGLLGGGLLFYIALNIVLLYIYRKIIYFVIAIWTWSILIFIYSLQGVIHVLDLGLNLTFITLYAWIHPHVGYTLLMLFTILFFDLKNRYKKTAYTLYLLIFCHFLMILTLSYGVYVDHSYMKYFGFTGLLAIINATVLIVAGLYMREIGSKFYLLGQMLLFFAIILSSLSIFGFIDFYEFHSYIVIIAIILDLGLLFIAQSLKTKHTIDKLNTNKLALIEQSRFSAMGYAINNITHQWKHPLTHLGTSLALIDAMIKNKKDEAIPLIENELPKANYSINLMKKTLDEFSNYYTKELKKGNFSPKDSIEHITYILKSKIILKNTTITLEIDENLKIYNYEHIFSNIILILIDNSLDAFDSKSNNKAIAISIVEKNNHLFITYKDNAGGIKIEPIEKVFEYSISSKEKKQNSGVGLSIVKMFVEERFNGDISVTNTKDGVEFLIKLENKVEEKI
jgi:two-component system, sensor histidine kinase LadS